MTDSYHPSTCAAGCVQVNQVIQVAVMQQQAMTAKNSAASKGDNGVHILQAQVIENALETWKYEVQILKYPQITILETQFWHLLKRGLGTLGSHVPGGKAALQRPVAPPVIKIISVPMETPALIDDFTWFLHIFPLKAPKKKHVNPIISSRFPLIFLSLDVPISFPCQCSFPSRNHGSGSRIKGSRLHLRATPLSQGNHMWGGWIQDDWGVIIHS